MQGNAPDEEYNDPHGECAAEIKRLQDVIKEMRSLGSIPAEDVAKFWMDNEALYYRTQFGSGALTRLTSVIERARLDGANARKESHERQRDS